MIALPIPLVVSLVLAFLAARLAMGGGRSRLFIALLLACSLQGLIVSLAQYYGVDALRAVQPVSAAFIPPLAWAAFTAGVLRPVSLRRDWPHIFGPIFILFCLLFAPLTLDGVLPALFLLYGLAILWRLHGADDLPFARLAADTLPRRIWQAAAGALILSATSDVAFAALVLTGHAPLAPLLVSATSSLALLAVGLICLAPDAATEAETDQASTPDTSADDTALMARLECMMETERPWLDPDLTLARLARRLHVPVKQLSGAINRATGDNVSRHINAYRIRYARTVLESGQSVTEAMLASGFNTKSNFNREFKRVTGQVPSALLQSPSP